MEMPEVRLARSGGDRSEVGRAAPTPYDDFWTATGEIDGNIDDWDGESLMPCLRCKYTAKADEFETKPSE
jgi:hypothetical protein